MSAPVRFLNALAQSLSTMVLYSPEHPAWTRAVRVVREALAALVAQESEPRFSFVGDEVVFGRTALHEMAGWNWTAKLASVGVQRIEFHGLPEPEELEKFLADVLRRLARGTTPSARAADASTAHIRYGAIAVLDEDQGALEALIQQVARTPAESLPFGMGEEVNTIEWLQSEAAQRGKLELAEADTVVRSLTVAMRGSSAMIIPLLRLKASDPYNAIHAINVSVLAMAFAEYLGLGGKTVHELGTAALLHDLGMARVPKELLGKPETLTDREREIIERHTSDGARLIAASDKRMELASLVAFEHHLRPNGSGYPKRIYERPPHRASAFVRICSVYNALRLPRAHRTTMTADQSLEFIDQRAGLDFDTELAPAFTGMMRRLEKRVTVLDRDGTVRSPALTPAPLPVVNVDY